METLDTLVTYAYDLTLGGGTFYIGTSLMLHLAKRWNALEPRPKAVRLPLALKEGQALELAPAPMTELLRATLPEFQSLKPEMSAPAPLQEL